MNNSGTERDLISFLLLNKNIKIVRALYEKKANFSLQILTSNMRKFVIEVHLNHISAPQRKLRRYYAVMFSRSYFEQYLLLLHVKYVFASVRCEVNALLYHRFNRIEIEFHTSIINDRSLSSTLV